MNRRYEAVEMNVKLSGYNFVAARDKALCRGRNLIF